MALPERVPVELRSGRAGVHAFVDGRWLGPADVEGGTVNVHVPTRNLVSTRAIQGKPLSTRCVVRGDTPRSAIRDMIDAQCHRHIATPSVSP